MRYLVDIEMQMLVDSNLDAEDVAENLYARLCELAYSDEHLLQLSVFPKCLPPENDIEPLDSGDAAFQQA